MEPTSEPFGFAPPPRPALSVTEPVSKAIEHTRRMLFPFDAGKWLTLGFVAWLAYLGEGGGSIPQLPDTSGGGRGGGYQPVLDWIRDNLSLTLIIVVAVLLVSTLIGAVILWISSRARLMLIDDIVKNEAKVEEPWRRFRELGRSLFLVRLWIALLQLGVTVVGLGAGGALAWADLAAGTFGHGALVGLVVAIAIILLGAIPLAIASALIDDFVVPAMYLHDEPVGPAWRRAKEEIITGNVGTIVLFYLMKFALGIAIGVLATLGTCITCCLASLPYLGTVILLPLFIFPRCYSLFFVQQFGPGWQLFPAPEANPWEVPPMA